AALRRLIDEDGLWAELAARIPPLPPDLAAHVDAIEAIYEEARAAPPRQPQFGPVASPRRRAFWQQLCADEQSGRMPPGPPR
ncbi:MAG: hypothetical protein VYD05_08545, partial [Planctomycetota bacterium]|nr:hypothetical protein [Planctomycetota bacterium]